MKKIAVIRCETVSEVCPGVGCLKAFHERRVYFKDYKEEDMLIGFFTCGGCSGRRISRLLKSLMKYDLDAVHLSSCMLFDGEYPRCPHLDEIKKTLTRSGVEIIDGTHH
jgi:predicted metal-binding protein